MDPGVLNFFGVAMALAVSFAVGGGLFVAITTFVKRIKRPPRTPSTEELEDLRYRLEALERRVSQHEELEERLDFLERVLLAQREGKATPQALPPRQE